ncbi:MAG: TetR/AcrR family transcriptional regulator [Actinomycetota bacterium]|nr:TetR/AcrR family transcriptional regulator [Actinomycetota bacterium]
MPQTQSATRPQGDPGAGVPRATRGEEWKRGRRRDLLDAASRVICRAGASASMDDIANEAGISRVILYRYFGDKSGLYAAVAEHYVDDLMNHLGAALLGSGDTESRLRRTVETYVQFIEDNKQMYDFLIHRPIKEGPISEGDVAGFMRNVAGQIAEVLAQDISDLGFDPAPAQAWAHGVVGMVHVSSDWWLQGGDVSRAEFVDYLVALLSHGFIGLAADPGVAEAAGLRRLEASS